LNPATLTLRYAFADPAISEQVTFRGEPCTVRISRSPARRVRERFNFGEGTQSIVELSPDLGKPKAGETLLDEFDRYHRIEEVHFDGVIWRCACTVSSIPS
jgi:hypothetical protein